jgi:hypothetical protein
VQHEQSQVKYRGPAALLVLLLSLLIGAPLSAQASTDLAQAVSETRAAKSTPVVGGLKEGRQDAARPLDVPTLSSEPPMLVHRVWASTYWSLAVAAAVLSTSVQHQARAPPAH